MQFVKSEQNKVYRFALHLQRLVEMLDPNCEVMYGLAARSLLAELDGDFDSAIRYRKMEIAGVKQILETSTPRALELMQMGPDDYSDRLDLLALNYLDAKEYQAALAVLDESEAYCKQHNIPFDGEAVRADVKKAMRKRKKVARAG